MARRPRRNHSNDFKAKVALAAIKAEKTLAELSAEFDEHQIQHSVVAVCDCLNVLNESCLY